jgi:hypothetical protein
MILSSKPVTRLSCLGISSGSKLPLRSRGSSTRGRPSPEIAVLALVPLRWLPYRHQRGQGGSPVRRPSPACQAPSERPGGGVDLLARRQPVHPLVHQFLRDLRQRRAPEAGASVQEYIECNSLPMDSHCGKLLPNEVPVGILEVR